MALIALTAVEALGWPCVAPPVHVAEVLVDALAPHATLHRRLLAFEDMNTRA